MFGGVDVSVLDKIKDSSTSYVKVALQILTPLEYMEFVGKMLLVIDLKKVELCLLLAVILNMVILFGGLFFNIGISKVALSVSSVMTVICYFSVIAFRKKKSKSEFNYEIGKINVDEIVVDDFEVPEALQRYKCSEAPTLEVTESDLNSLVNPQPKPVSKSRKINLDISDVNSLDLSNLDVDIYFKENAK